MEEEGWEPCRACGCHVQTSTHLGRLRNLLRIHSSCLLVPALYQLRSSAPQILALCHHAAGCLLVREMLAPLVEPPSQEGMNSWRQELWLHFPWIPRAGVAPGKLRGQVPTHTLNVSSMTEAQAPGKLCGKRVGGEFIPGLSGKPSKDRQVGVPKASLLESSTGGHSTGVLLRPTHIQSTEQVNGRQRAENRTWNEGTP